jgi:hypothetical protein
VEVKERYQVKISNRFAALKNLDNNDLDINSAQKTTRENRKPSAAKSLGYCEMKQHKLWFDEMFNIIISKEVR